MVGDVSVWSFSALLAIMGFGDLSPVVVWGCCFLVHRFHFGRWFYGALSFIGGGLLC